MDKDRRSPDQDTALERAFIAARLPEEDRRAPEPLAEENQVELAAALEPPGPIANDEIHVVRERPDGVKVTAGGHILE
jgi:hypothetical protein